MPTAASVVYPSAAIDAFVAAVQFDAQGLVPAIAQQHDTGEVLMMAWMDRDAVIEQCARAAPVTGRARARRRGARATRPAISRRWSICASTATETRCWCWSTRQAPPAIPDSNWFFGAIRGGALETITPAMVDMDKIGKDKV